MRDTVPMTPYRTTLSQKVATVLARFICAPPSRKVCWYLIIDLIVALSPFILSAINTHGRSYRLDLMTSDRCHLSEVIKSILIRAPPAPEGGRWKINIRGRNSQPDAQPLYLYLEPLRTIWSHTLTPTES